MYFKIKKINKAIINFPGKTNNCTKSQGIVIYYLSQQKNNPVSIVMII